MKKYIFFLPAIIFIYPACKSNKNDKQEDFFPVLPFIQNDVADVDTAFYPIIKIISENNMKEDTIFVKREDFRELAKEFLQLPDLTQKKFKKRFVEEKFFDRSLNRAIITYRPKSPENEEIQRQEILIYPNNDESKVKTIIIDKSLYSRDNSVQKRMLWQVGKSFQITSLIQKPGTGEVNTTIKVVWND